MPSCAITGQGVVSGAGFGVAALANALRTGQSVVQSTSRFASVGLRVSVAGVVPGFELEPAATKIAPTASEVLASRVLKCARRSPRSVQLAVLAALEAWVTAGLDRNHPDPTRVGVVVAGHNINQAYQYATVESTRGTPEYILPTYALHFMDFDLVGTLSEVFGIRGEGFTTGGACASGNVGICQAARLLRCAELDVCLVVGALADLSPVELQAFRQLGALGGERFRDTPARACRPFDREHDGFVFGEASAAVVLESSTSARSRGVPVIADLAGCASVLDGNRLSNPNPGGQARAMCLAMREANVGPSEVDYVSTHGTASPAGDASELAAIREAFGAEVSRVRLNATKAITGHCLWSAGVVEAIATSIQMEGGFLHPSVNLDSPIEDGFAFAGPVCEPMQIEVALSNSFGFGGISTAIVLKKGRIQ